MTYPPPPPPPPPGVPPPYGAPQGGYPVQQPDNNLVWAILSTLLCCLPLGVVSIIYSSKVSGLWLQGRYAEAQAAADNAKKWAIWSAVAGVVGLIIYGILIFAGAMAGFMSVEP